MIEKLAHYLVVLIVIAVIAFIVVGAFYGMYSILTLFLGKIFSGVVVGIISIGALIVAVLAFFIMAVLASGLYSR